MGQQLGRKKILIVCDAVAATGLARVAYSIFEPLTEKYELHQLAINFGGDPHEWPWKLYPATRGNDDQGIQRIRELVIQIQPEMIIMINDFWHINNYLWQIRDVPKRDQIKTIAYTNADGTDFDPNFIVTFQSLNVLVAYNHFSKNEFEKAARLIQIHKPDYSLPRIEIMPHGVDSKVFYPLEEDFANRKGGANHKQLRESLWGSQTDITDAFIVLNANRNQSRKRIDVTIEGFARFAAGKPDNVKLHLHMGAIDHGWDLLKLAGLHEISHRLILATPNSEPPEFPEWKLNRVYNACDVGINTATGEGWGLVSFEHAATGAAQIVPNHSACAELWAGAAEILPIATHYRNTETLTKMAYVDPQAVADALERLYRDADLLKKMSAAAYQNATKPEYVWETISKKWESLIAEVLN